MRAVFSFVFLNLFGSASADLEWPLVIDRDCNWPYASAGRGGASLPWWAIALIATQSIVLLLLVACFCCLPCSPLHRWLSRKLRAFFGRRACEDVEQQQKGGNLLAEAYTSK